MKYIPSESRAMLWQENMSQQEAEQFEIEQKQKERDFENLLRTTLTTKKGFKKGNFGDTRADSDHYGQL